MSNNGGVENIGKGCVNFMEGKFTRKRGNVIVLNIYNMKMVVSADKR